MAPMELEPRDPILQVPQDLEAPQDLKLLDLGPKAPQTPVRIPAMEPPIADP